MKFSIKDFKALSTLYLSLPVLVFLLAWVKVWIAIPVCIMLFLAFYYYLQDLKSVESKHVKFNCLHFLGIVIIGLLWVSMSGTGGFGMLIHDQQKMYAIIKDIMEQQFPITYNYAGENYYLSSYIAYYISAPILFGWFSYDAVNIFLFLYATIGVIIGLLWFSILSGNKLIYAALFFVLVGGADLAGYLFQKGFSEGIGQIFAGESIQYWWYNSFDVNQYLLYHGNTNVLFWAATHAIPCWVASGIFFYDVLIEKKLEMSPIYLFPIVFWSPFILLGLFPYFLYVSYINRGSISNYINKVNVLIIPAFLIVLWFVNSISVDNIDKAFFFGSFESINLFFRDGFRLFWFLFFEVMIWMAFVWLTSKDKLKGHAKHILIIVAICLIGIPFYKLGKYNDWVQRVSMPSLFLLWIFVLKGFSYIKNRIKLISALVLLFLCSFDSLSLIKLSIENNGLSFDYHPMKYEKIKPIPETSVENGWPLDQIVAKGQPSFFKYIAKDKKSKFKNSE